MKKLSKKKILIVTGSRADYGILKNLISCLNNSKKFQLSLVVTGQHLSKNYGTTSKIVINDFNSAVSNAIESGKRGDILLLSPGCTSFDQFQNYEQRGNSFKKIISEYSC